MDASLRNTVAEPRRASAERLIAQGVLRPVRSFEQYAELANAARQNAQHRLLGNCYMLPDEIKRLIRMGWFYRLDATGCLAFVDDEDDYYSVFLFADLERSFHLPQLDRDMLVENIYYDQRKTHAQERFESAVLADGFRYESTYLSVWEKPQLSPDVFWQRMKAVQRSLAAENKRVVAANEGQVEAFRKIYKDEIAKYTRKRYSDEEWKAYARNRLLSCVADEKGEVYAIRINSALHSSFRGGAIAARHDCHGRGYATALLLSEHIEFYRNIPDGTEKQIRYMESKAIGPWISTDNKASWRLFKGIGRTASGKAMTQFVKPGFDEQ